MQRRYWESLEKYEEYEENIRNILRVQKNYDIIIIRDILIDLCQNILAPFLEWGQRPKGGNEA